MTIVLPSTAAGCTLLSLRTEVLARGFDYLSATRANGFINNAYNDICDAGGWSFLEATATGTGPLDIPGMRQVIAVTDTTNDSKLEQIDFQTLTDCYGDLSLTGTPAYWYRDTATQIAVFPLNTSVQLSVRCLVYPTDLVADTDKTMLPSRFCRLVVDGAVIYAYKDSDNWEAVRAAQADYDRQLTLLFQSLKDQVDSQLIVAGAQDWSDW